MNNRDSISHVVHHHEFMILMRHGVKDMDMFQVPVVGDGDLSEPRQFNLIAINSYTGLVSISDIRDVLVDVFVYRYYNPQQYHTDLKSIWLPSWALEHFYITNIAMHYYNYKKADKIIEFLYKEYLKTAKSTNKQFDPNGVTPWERMLAEELGHE